MRNAIEKLHCENDGRVCVLRHSKTIAQKYINGSLNTLNNALF